VFGMIKERKTILSKTAVFVFPLALILVNILYRF
jgi:hypothetical protein